ncbi:MAG TPA: YegP family protein, partial [Flavobacteriales bacterium]|nr:YegP family protein [Flavobacteriales bacterium]
MNGIESVKTNAVHDANYERKKSDAGHSFNLLAANDQVVGTSQVYTSTTARDKGIESVRTNAPTAGLMEV